MLLYTHYQISKRVRGAKTLPIPGTTYSYRWASLFLARVVYFAEIIFRQIREAMKGSPVIVAEQTAYDAYRRTSKPSLASSTENSGLNRPDGVLGFENRHVFNSVRSKHVDRYHICHAYRWIL